MGPLLAHAATQLPKDVDVSALAEIAQKGVAGDLDLQLNLLMAVRTAWRWLASRAGIDQAGARTGSSTLHRSRGVRPTGSIDRDGMPGRPWRIEAPVRRRRGASAVS